MDEQVRSGIVAILAGGLVGFVLFVPFVALSYRRRGSLTLGRATLWALALVYFWAIWTYTLLPLPDPDSMRCAGVNLDVWAFTDDIRGAIARPGPTLTDPAILQLLLNVVLFIPLGFFVRVLGGRGILVAGLVGLVTSVFIETTQLTGVWGIYPCAYRVFDVDDMLTNTIGALVGSLAALAVPARARGLARAVDADEPRPVTRRRRALGMLCDAVGLGLSISTVSTVVQLWLQFVVADTAAVRDGTIAAVIGTVSGLVVWLVVILITGRSVGDLTVRVRFAGGVLPTWLARPVRWLLGVSGYVILDALPDPWSILALPFGVATLVLLLIFRDGRGLAGAFGATVVDDRATPRSRETAGR